ncbi:uncharacterized protein LOC119719185 [Patiria miniata]|uniref:BHLH domain-containing protein n=1 Tax=Patiria miniata TaxID=46514 RepID=A0A913YXJ5_PATMI|nr:uncharacterized protein LOC119719185 [Patiria miniata]
MAASMEQDPDALLDIVLRMDSNNNNSSSNGHLAPTFQDSETPHANQIPVYTDLSTSVFDDIDAVGDGHQLTDLNGLIDIDNLATDPFGHDASSLPNHQGSTVNNLAWGQPDCSPTHALPNSQTSEFQTVSPGALIQTPVNYQNPGMIATHHGTLPGIQFITVHSQNLPRHAPTKVTASGAVNHTPSKSKTRRRVTTASQRKAANVRERRRMFNLNEAFDVLRKNVPTFTYEKRLSRIETLRLAMLYITFMGDVLSGNRADDGNLKKLLESGNFAGLTNSNPGPGPAVCHGQTVLNSAASRMNSRTNVSSGGINGS